MDLLYWNASAGNPHPRKRVKSRKALPLPRNSPSFSNKRRQTLGNAYGFFEHRRRIIEPLLESGLVSPVGAQVLPLNRHRLRETNALKASRTVMDQRVARADSQKCYIAAAHD